MKRIAPVLLLLATTALAGAAQAASPLLPGNLVVAVEGKGNPNDKTTYADNQAAPISLYQFSHTGTSSASLVNINVLPSQVSGEYGSSSEGFLQLSGNGKVLTMMAYGVNAKTFNDAVTKSLTNGTDPYGVKGNDPTKPTALGQSSSVACGAGCTPVARDVIEIGASGSASIGASVFGVYNGNNPRSVFTQDGSTFYISGQGASPDHTGGVFEVGKGVTNATLAANGITGDDTTGKTFTQDTRFITGVNGQLLVSVDSKEGSNSARDFIGSLGPIGSTGLYDSGNGPTELTNFATATGKVTLSSSNGNGLFPSAKINLSPEEFFFASNKSTDDTLYIADSGNPKNDSNAPKNGPTDTDGGLQKWSLVNGTWQLDYTLSANLNLVADTAASGTTGLFGLTAQVVNGQVQLFATNSTIGDTDPTFLFGITDTLSFTKATQASGESFSVLATAGPDMNFKGVAFAPTGEVPEPATYALMIAGFGLLGGALRRRRAGFAAA